MATAADGLLTVDCWLLTAGSWLRSLLVFCILVHFIDKLCAAHLWRGLDAQRRFCGYVSMAVLLHMQAVRIYASNFNAQEFFLNGACIPMQEGCNCFPCIIVGHVCKYVHKVALATQCLQGSLACFGIGDNKASITSKYARSIVSCLWQWHFLRKHYWHIKGFALDFNYTCFSRI